MLLKGNRINTCKLYYLFLLHTFCSLPCRIMVLCRQHHSLMKSSFEQLIRGPRAYALLAVHILSMYGADLLRSLKQVESFLL